MHIISHEQSLNFICNYQGWQIYVQSMDGNSYKFDVSEVHSDHFIVSCKTQITYA